MNILTISQTRWNTVNWKKFQITVFKWQRQIYKASKAGDIRKTRRIQHYLLNSTEAKFLAVRRVTQDNKGKKTAGIDKVKSLTPTQRTIMAFSLRFPTPGSPLRRVWIPKPGSVEKRPLGIPVIRDRC
jgi:RNA-directed DNA polymerase